MQITFHKSQASKGVEIATGTTMDKVRTKLTNELNFMSADDRFLKWSTDNNIKGRSQLPTDVEQYLSIEAMTQNSPQGNNITLSKPGASQAAFSGIRKTHLVDRHLQVQVVRNMTESDGSAAKNNGKMAPILLSNVISTDPNVSIAPNRDDSNIKMVICEKGTVIQFNIASWAAAGYGYSITSEKIKIADGLYIGATRQQVGTVIPTGLQKFQSSGNTIEVDSVKDIQKSFVGSLETADVSVVRIKSWRVTSINYNGTQTTSNLQPPALRGSSGDFVFDRENTESAAPHEGDGPSNQKFVGVSNIVENRNDIIGDMTLIFYVFRNKAAADRVVEAINQGVFAS